MNGGWADSQPTDIKRNEHPPNNQYRHQTCYTETEVVASSMLAKYQRSRVEHWLLGGLISRTCRFDSGPCHGPSKAGFSHAKFRRLSYIHGSYLYAGTCGIRTRLRGIPVPTVRHQIAVQFFPVKPSKIVCNCQADATEMSTVIRSLRGRPPNRVWKRSQMVLHYRASDDASFWHWLDQSSNLTGNT